MNKVIINKLFESFDSLENAILNAKKTLSKKSDVPKDILDRIDNYEEILNKQRLLALSLNNHSKNGNWDEVSRHIKLINSLSTMIRDDAREILFSGEKSDVETKEHSLIC